MFRMERLFRKKYMGVCRWEFNIFIIKMVVFFNRFIRYTVE